MPTFVLNAFLHQTAFNFSTKCVGGMWSAIKFLFFLKNCLLPHWWHPSLLPRIWIIFRCFWFATLFVDSTEPLLRNGMLRAWTPSAITLEGTAVINNFFSKSEKIPSPRKAWEILPSDLITRKAFLLTPFAPVGKKSSWISLERRQLAVIEAMPKALVAIGDCPLCKDIDPARRWTEFVNK